MRKCKPSGFDKRLQDSIQLLQKAERLALKYDADDGFFLAFSGGKDSQALYHVAQMAGVRFKAHMNFTSVDPPQVIRFVRRQYPDVITHAPNKSIFQLAVDRGILPSMRIRWCCADLKETAGAGKVTLIGIRRQESVRRAKRHEVEVSNKQFSGTLEEFDEWQKQKIASMEERLIKKMHKEGKKVNEDEFSLTQNNEIRCINGKDSILISPIFEWSEQDVWYFLNEVAKVPHCELYDMGYHRIGCILCPMSNYKQKVKELRDYPHVKRGWIKAIKAIRAGVFKREYIWWNIKKNWQTERCANRKLSHRPPPSLEQESKHRYLGWIKHPDKQHWTGFSSSPSSNGIADGDSEDIIAENIFDWWISGKSYTKWYAEKFLQLKLFNDNEETETIH